ncbi:MAG: DMT family transporter [Oscillospiraceae bacterium]|nr:DMT family transporter [Oscillospiraceae bacterium]
MKNKSYSFSAFIASMLIFGTIGIFRRFLPLSSGFLAFSRGIIGSCFLFLVAVFNHKAIFRSPGRRTLLLLLLSGALIGLNWVLLFEAYNRTTVAAATLCYYMEPTIVTLLSPLFLKEKLTVKKLLCALAAVIGMLFVVCPAWATTWW